MHIPQIALMIYLAGYLVTVNSLVNADLLWWRKFDYVVKWDYLLMVPFVAFVALAWPLWLIVAVALRMRDAVA